VRWQLNATSSAKTGRSLRGSNPLNPLFSLELSLMIRAAILACTLIALIGCSAGDSSKDLVASAKALMEKRDFAGAVVQLKNALQKSPDSGEARFLLGRALLQAGDAAGALVELRKAEEAQTPDALLAPEMARALLAAGESSMVVQRYEKLSLSDGRAIADLKTSLASAYMSKGSVELAQSAAAAALQAQPDYTPAVIVLARLDLADGKIDSALAQLDGVLSRDAGNEAAGLLKGEILMNAKRDPAGALASYRAVSAANPRSVGALAAVVETLILQSQEAAARVEFEKLKKLSPQHPSTLYYQAQFAFADKDYKTTLEIADRMLAVLPNNARVLTLAGAAEFSMQRYTLAEGLLVKAVKSAPGLALPRQLLAQTYLRIGQADRAVAALQPLVDSAQADVASLTLAGEAYLRAGDSRRSDAAFQRALKTAPQDSRIRTAVALAGIARGDSAPSFAQLEAIAKGDTNAQADLALVNARWQRGDIKGALSAIDALERKLPTQAYPHILRGRVLGGQGDLPGATASFEKALGKEPKDFAATAGLADMDYFAGRRDAARKRLDDFVKADPKHIRARLALAALDTLLGATEATVVAQLVDAVKAAPSDNLGHLALIDRLLAGNDVQRAQVAAQDATAALPTDPQIMDALGRAHLAAGDSQRALTVLKALTSMQPKSAPHQVRLSEAYLAGKDSGGAMRALRQAVDLDPEHLPAQRKLALLLTAERRAQEGLEIARSIQKRQPQEATGFMLEGELEANNKNWSAAAAAYRSALQKAKSTEAAIKLHETLVAAGKGVEADRLAADWRKENPKDLIFIYQLGDAAVAAKNWPQADAMYRAVITQQPGHAAAINNLAWVMATRRQAGASAMAERAVALLPDRAALLDTLAFTLEVENQLPKAIEVQKRAAQLEPRSPGLRLRLAQLLIKKGDKAGAREELEKLAKLGSQFEAQAEVTALLKGL
jgi:putative PEP-CTERM system TPR-repeat lipoprotein